MPQANRYSTTLSPSAGGLNPFLLASGTFSSVCRVPMETQQRKAEPMKARRLKVLKIKRKFKRLCAPMKMPFEEMMDIASKRHSR